MRYLNAVAYDQGRLSTGPNRQQSSRGPLVHHACHTTRAPRHILVHYACNTTRAPCHTTRAPCMPHNLCTMPHNSCTMHATQLYQVYAHNGVGSHQKMLSFLLWITLKVSLVFNVIGNTANLHKCFFHHFI